MTNSDKAIRYGALKMTELEIKEELKQLKPEVLEFMETLDEDEKFDLIEGHTLSLRQDKKWSYPAYLEDKAQKLREDAAKLEKTWQVKNPTKFETTPVIKFNRARK